MAANTKKPQFPHYSARHMVADSNIEMAQRQSLFILCSTQVAKLNEYAASFFSHPYDEVTLMDAGTLRDNYQCALSQGLVLDEELWDQLQAQSKKVLVESSEQSRMGAGA